MQDEDNRSSDKAAQPERLSSISWAMSPYARMG